MPKAKTFTAPPSQEVRDEALRRAAMLAAGLFPHQVDGVAFLLARRRAILADDMGLGKTRQSIVALREVAPEGPYLVACPASVKHHWACEIRAVAPDALVTVLGERATGAIARQPSPTEVAADQGTWAVVTYDLLGPLVSLLERISWAGLIFDEAHYLQKHTSQHSKWARRLVAACTDPVVYVLTGTSLASRPGALFPLLQLAGHTLGRSYATFAKRYGTSDDRAHIWAGGGAANSEELTRQLRGVMLRRSRDEILSLPPKLRTWLSVDVPRGTGVREVRAVIRLLIESRLGSSLWRPGARLSADGSRTDRIRLMTELTTARQKLAVAKVPFTIDLVQGAVDQGEKLLVFSCFAEPVKEIQAHFGDAAVLLTGATPASKRQKIVERFQTDPSVRVFVASPVAGGLSVTAARQVVFNDLDWMPVNHWLAEDLASRISRTGTVNVSYLVGAGTIDEFVQRVLETRAALVSAAADFESVAAEAGADLLSELERAIGLLSPELADLAGGPPVASFEAHLLRRVAALIEPDPAVPSDFVHTSPSSPSREALLRLAEILSASSDRRYRAANPATPGAFETVDVDATGNVICSCSGFVSLGGCEHAQRLSEWTVTGGTLPEGFSADDPS